MIHAGNIIHFFFFLFLYILCYFLYLSSSDEIKIFNSFRSYSRCILVQENITKDDDDDDDDDDAEIVIGYGRLYAFIRL